MTFRMFCFTNAIVIGIIADFDTNSEKEISGRIYISPFIFYLL